MNFSYKEDLICRYLRGGCTLEEKRSVFALLQCDSEFIELMKVELDAIKRMSRLRTQLTDDKKRQLLGQLRVKIEHQPDANSNVGALHDPWSEWVLQKTLPGPAFHTIETLKRRCYL